MEGWPKENVWLQLPKDVWKMIVLRSLWGVPSIYYIGWYDFPSISRLRTVCRFFASLLDPRFCLKIIFSNPRTNASPFYCGVCTLSSEVRSDGICQFHLEKRNPYFRKERSKFSKSYKWAYRVNHKTFSPVGFSKLQLAKPRANVTQTQQRNVISVTEQNVFNRHGRKLDGNSDKKNVIKYDPIKGRSHPNKRKPKFWKCNEKIRIEYESDDTEDIDEEIEYFNYSDFCYWF
jgi:hypothetical protein